MSELTAALAGRHGVPDFEAAFARLMGQSCAVAFPYGRTGLLLLLEALGLKNRDIILPAYTCVVVAHAVVLSGNRPVFIDSAKDGFNMDLDKAEAAISANTGALIATSIHGYPVDLDRLDALSARHPGVTVIQDCAHSFSAEWKGRPVQRAGRAAIFGLNISKLMTSIFGGMVTTDDAALADRLRALRASRVTGGDHRSLMRALYLFASSAALTPAAFGLVKHLSDSGLLDRFVRYYDETLIDMPGDHLAGLGRAEASVGIIQTGKYPGIVERRREMAAYYDRALAPLHQVRRPPLVQGATYSHYVLRVTDPDRMVREASRYGIELGRLIDYCIPDMPAYRDAARLQGPFDQTRALNASVLNLPIWVGKSDADRVIDALFRITGTR